MSVLKKTLDKGTAYLKKNGVRRAFQRAVRKAALSIPVDYERWMKRHLAGEGALRKQRTAQSGEDPKVAVVLYETGGNEGPARHEKRQAWRRATLDSLTAQTYGNLAVCMGGRSPAADYYLLVEEGTCLRQEAIYEMVQAAKVHPRMQVIYSDHDIRGEKGKLGSPFFKPEYDEVLLGEFNYVGTVCLIKAKLLEGAEQKAKSGRRTRHDLYETVKVLAGLTSNFYRLAKPLYHIPKEWDPAARFISAQQTGEGDPGSGENREENLKDRPLVSVIIPNKDHFEELEACVKSLLEEGGYSRLEILIVENNSTDPETIKGYHRLAKEDSIRILYWKKEFNYSAINNYAAEEAAGEYLLFLNNDTKIKRPGSLGELMRQCAREQVGAVGARLVYEDETIQHAGVVLGYGGIAGHAFEGIPVEDYEKTVWAWAVRQMSAVTGACMLTKKEAFRAVGGFTEAFGVAYNDIDLCMKLQHAGWKVLYDPLAQLYHYESKTRGLELTREKANRVKGEAELFCGRWEKALLQGDPFYNPNLTLEKQDFSLRR